MKKTETSNGLEYTRLVLNETKEWYKSAENKAQIALTLNGLFIGFLSSNFLNDQKNPKTIIADNIFLTLLLILITITIIVSITFALSCIKSRFGKSDISKNAILDHEGNLLKYDIQHLTFFDNLRQMDSEILSQQLVEINPESEIKILAYELVALSKNVKAKHNYANLSFLFFGCELVFFLLFFAISLFR